ncbi:hypothetical protein V5O48_013684 [Marasmius crinis-equi]|uniref:Uncharacterized protein n=1 Tax=Marasmius crinis-equi TaxID=585013 RepID=A0ABR3EZH0_9AGAR
MDQLAQTSLDVDDVAELGEGILGPKVILGKYLRFVLPCVTPLELEIFMRKLESSKETLSEIGDHDRAPLNQRYDELSMEASKIKLANLRAVRWTTYFGFHLGLVPSIIRCHWRAERLLRDVAIKREELAQNGMELERIDVPPAASTAPRRVHPRV